MTKRKKKDETPQNNQQTPPDVILTAAAAMLGVAPEQLKQVLATIKQPAETKEKMLTRAAAAELLQVSVKTLVNWDRSGHLQPIRLTTRSLRYRQSDILRLLDGSNNGKAA
jgi:hypothetical protein